MKANRYILLFLAWVHLTGIAQPSNDLPCNAIELSINDTCSFALYSNTEAGDSGIPDPGCGSYEGGDIWFYMVIPPDSSVEIQTHTEAEEQFPLNNGWMYRAAMALYHGNCDTLSTIGCFENNSTYHPRMAGASLSEEIPGDTLWVRIWENSNNDNGMFRICVTGIDTAGASCPEPFDVSGGGSHCKGDTGVAVSLSGSEYGTDYTLLMNDTIRLDTLSGNGGILTWSPLSLGGVYKVEAIRASDSCVAMMNGSAMVWVVEPPTVSADAISISCFGKDDGSISLMVDTGTPYTVSWTGPGGFISSDQNLTHLAPGDYQATATDSNHCASASENIPITEPQLLVASVDQVSHLTRYEANDGAVSLSVKGGTTPFKYSWTGTDGFESSRKNPSGMSVGYYNVMVTDDHLCMDSIRMILVSLDEESNLVFVPEGFSPNGDGLNDLFVILGLEQFPDNELLVFNRQGVEVLHRLNYKNDWDGRPEKGGILGSVLPEGTYYYVLRFGESGMKKGYVYINRE